MVHVQVRGNGKAGVLKCRSCTGELIQASIDTLQGVQPCAEQPISRSGLTFALTPLCQLPFFKGLQTHSQDKVWCCRIKTARSFVLFCFLLLVIPQGVWMLSACPLHTNATVTTVLFQCPAKGKQTACSWEIKTHQPKQNYRYEHNLSIKMSFLLSKPYFKPINDATINNQCSNTTARAHSGSLPFCTAKTWTTAKWGNN